MCLNTSEQSLSSVKSTKTRKQEWKGEWDMTKHPRIMRKQPLNVMEHEGVTLYGCISEHTPRVEAFDMQFEVW